ncbi:MAG TPA: hypothetical protein VIR16_08460 [Candidatus Limnocylindrales bacterium]
MDSLLLLGLAIGILLVAVWALYVARRPHGYPDTGLARSTEGMTICPRCGMGNLWTSRQCSACGNTLRG